MCPAPYRSLLSAVLVGILATAVSLTGALGASASASVVLPESERASAVNASSASIVRASTGAFDPGLIVSDWNFYNSWAMSESEIQAFLDSHIAGPCTNDNCLNVLRLDTPTRTWSFGTCSTYAGALGESAARIIFKVQRACGISAKVLLVTLQKEQGLVSSTAPSEGVLRKAMGFACPVSSVCDSTYYGFFNQVFAAARQLAWYGNPDGSFTWYTVGAINPIRYSDYPSCGSGNVYLSSKATAALYYYTPYQPTAAALALGTGANSDPCSSYGNRNFFNYWKAWFGDPTTGYSPAVTRTAGDDRWETAAAISRSSFSGGSPVVYITTGTDFPDALSAGPAAAAQGGPLLLVDRDYVPAATMSELTRLAPATVVIVGGNAAVSDVVAGQLAAPGRKVTRIAGVDRYDTSDQVAKYAFKTSARAYLATGLDFPDALSTSAAAGVARIPILLVNGKSSALDSGTAAIIAALGAKSLTIVGGTAVVTPEFQSSLASPTTTVNRLAGSDRYQTSVEVNRAAFAKTGSLYLATGTSFPDALAGSAAAAAAKSPLYVTFSSCLPAEIRTDIAGTGATSVKLLGGPAVLNDALGSLPVC